mmetsp:Transcript_86893/g.173820  ORF Transcript_86893/g.173820 Transcript_86893/m.173820 type:complete len:544 (+) Transcript_86893:348-1979(+)
MVQGGAVVRRVVSEELGRARLAFVLLQEVVGPHRRAGDLTHGLRLAELDALAQKVHGRGHVARVREKVGLDARGRKRVAALELNGAAGVRVQHRGAHHKTFRFGRRVVGAVEVMRVCGPDVGLEEERVRGGAQDADLRVGAVTRVRRRKRARRVKQSGVVGAGGVQPFAEEEPVEEREQRPRQTLGLVPVGAANVLALARGEPQKGREVVFEVLPHVWVVHHARDAHFLQRGFGADSGEQEELRRAHRAARHHHFARRQKAEAATAFAFARSAAGRVRHFDAFGALAVGAEEHARGVGKGDDREVALGRLGGQKRRVGVAARAVADRLLEQRGLVVHGPVVVVAALEAQLRGAHHEPLGDGVARARHAHAQWAAGSVRREVQRRVLGAVGGQAVFGLEEVGQHLVPGPTLGAEQRGPGVEVLLGAAHVRHVVDNGGPAEALSARPIAHRAVEPQECITLRLRLELPVAWALLHLAHCHGHLGFHLVGLPASLDERHVHCGVLREARRKHRAGTSRTANDEVVFLESGLGNVDDGHLAGELYFL